MGKDRPRAELKLMSFLVEDGDSGDIRGQEIGGELNSMHTAINGLGESLCQHGLTNTRNIFKEQVALSQ